MHYENNINRLEMPNSAIDLVECSRPDLGLLQPENPDQPGGIKESQLFAEALKTLQLQPAVYEKEVVSRGGWFGGQKRFVSAGVLPEPARAKEPEQQPGATKNAHLDMLRKLVRSEVVLKIKESDRWSQWLAAGGMPIRRLLEIFPGDFDEMTAFQFIEGIGQSWRKSTSWTMFTRNVSQVERIYELLEQLTYAQIESLVIVLGEGRFVELGPMDVFGLFFRQIYPKEAQTIVQGTDGYYKTFRMLSKKCQGKA